MAPAPSAHPTRKVLSSFGLGKLDEGSAAVVNKHLERCPDCRSQVAEMSADSFLGRVREAQIPPLAKPGQSRTSSKTPGQPGAKHSAPPPSTTLPPELADHPDYEIKRELGRGGMGVVYLAYNTLMRRDEVLKVMGREILERPEALDRFRREIRAVAKLRHPNIVTAYHATRLGENIVFAMEFVDGLDLSKMVKAKGALPVAHACNFIYQAALGLQHAHEEGLVHRDIKPGNLMLSRKGNKSTIKILDFGLAKASRDQRFDGALTNEGQALGTPDFIAPEQIVNAPNVDIRADIYGLGGTLYYLLTGRPPFQANSLYDIYQAHMSRDADLLNLIRPEVPVELAALVAKMMAKEPNRRFQTPGEVAQTLTMFFKTGASRPSGSSADVSGINRPGSPIQTSVAGCTPAQPAIPAAVPTTHVRKPSNTRAQGAASENTLGGKKDEPTVDVVKRDSPVPKPAPAQGPVQRPSWIWPATSAAVLFASIALGVVIITIRGKNIETKVTLSDDQSLKVETPGVVVEPRASNEQSGTKPRSDNFGISPPGILAKARPVERGSEIANSTGMRLVLIPSGEFMMGSPDSDPEAEPDEKPQHKVRITRPFYLGVHEVTQAQYEMVMGVNPSSFSANGGGRDQVSGRSTDRHPVERVTWFDSVRFCNGLSDMEGRKRFYEIDRDIVRVQDWNGPGYRLPTEAEWEYACRAGEEMKYSFGDDPAGLGEFAWFSGNSGNRPHPVGEKGRNAFGLFDMHGNVWEWCWDYYGAYEGESVADPHGPPQGAFRMMRGNAFGESPRDYRSAYRDRIRHGPGLQADNLGFRAALGRSGRGEDQMATVGTAAPKPVLIPAAGPARRVHHVKGNMWSVEGDQLVKDGLDHEHLGFGDQSWTDYDLTLEARKSAGPGGIAVGFRGVSQRTYVLDVGVSNKHALHRWLTPDLREIRSTPGTIELNKWHKLKISLRGTRIRIDLDDNLLFDLTDDFSPKGGVGLHCVDCAGRFRNIRITGPDGTVLWEGPPDLPEK
jgi:formylglycine-generating enzyme required for sulfatase activity/serine/threonine protein kinase